LQIMYKWPRRLTILHPAQRFLIDALTCMPNL
jgi:hypothetical protein